MHRDEAETLLELLGRADARNGDDAAVIAVPDGEICVSTDSTVVGIHAPADLAAGALGRRAVGRALSDLAAMGALPIGLVCAVLVPDSQWDDAQAAMLGVEQRASEQGCAVLGGDMSAAPAGAALSLTVTVLGRRGGARAFATRGGARPGDHLYVTGSLGVHGEPPDRLRAGSVLARFAHAMIDLSDGLARDALHVARASACTLEIDLNVVPLAARGIDPAEAATRGDDYELLVALAPERAVAAATALRAACPALSFTRIGSAWHSEVEAHRGQVRFTSNGHEARIGPGFTHR